MSTRQQRTLLELIDAWQGVKVLTVGDAMWDHHHLGHMTRLAQEAPIPVFIQDSVSIRPGGAFNVVANLDALGCVATYATAPEPWTEKHRWFAGHSQVFRVDFDQVHKWPERLSLSVDDAVAFGNLVEEATAVVISDYAKGYVTEQLCRCLIMHARDHGRPVVVDPKGRRWDRYRGATVICPNEVEWEAAGCQVPDGSAVLAKHGAKGLAVCKLEPDSGETIAELFPAQARHVYDVTGAGDTVVAVVAATLAVGGTLSSGARLANLAAGHVVGELGTAVCPVDVLRSLVLTAGEPDGEA